ncbi:hypothetical protein GCM10010363_60820 [Streptomyces omiyaensis]|uniref:hypothetical protein n=1 Tax=Streptomyces omiyaensis TaxID=68247 RepID=UPI001678D79D|nr:hypothetical protein [Streptomyces omiyaensis]GGY71361.1 hypothetical protein GCM10010363_60820 [Streptomyces omiyaensis]
MSRTRQAFLLGRHLTEVTGVAVTLDYVSGAEWSMNWPDGPTDDEMRAHLDEALTSHRFAEMRDRKVTPLRGETSRSWAARAIASRREGTLATAVAEGAAHRRRMGERRLGPPDPRATPEYYALLRHVQELQRTTSYPERASAPEDEPLIEDLLAAATRTDQHGHQIRHVSKHDMAHVLLAVEHAPSGDQPPRLAVVPAVEEA